LPIADCVFTQSKIFISIRIQLVPSNKSLSVYEEVDVPFNNIHQQCVVLDVTLYIAVGDEDVMPLDGVTAKNCRPLKLIEVLIEVLIVMP